ncbi:MAG TPA: hypothetical protein VE868_03420 [Balneolaceae bacterium]|nr:hypothetical protein [Balneolaceae bacterium]
MDKEISQDQVDQLIDDAAYLQDEAEALKYVIDNVPYNESLPDERYSIAEMLLLIDHAQLSYYRPIIKEAVENPRPTHLDDFIDFKETFDPDGEILNNIQKLLSNLAKHRAGVINTLKNISIIDWETVVYKNEQQILLYDFVREMIRFDRRQLKKIAELVRVFNDQKQSERKLKHKRAMQNPSSNNKQ